MDLGVQEGHGIISRHLRILHALHICTHPIDQKYILCKYVNHVSNPMCFIKRNIYLNSLLIHSGIWTLCIFSINTKLLCVGQHPFGYKRDRGVWKSWALQVWLVLSTGRQNHTEFAWDLSQCFFPCPFLPGFTFNKCLLIFYFGGEEPS